MQGIGFSEQYKELAISPGHAQQREFLATPLVSALRLVLCTDN